MSQDERALTGAPPIRPSAEASASLLDHDIRAALADVVGGLDLIEGSALAPDSAAQLDRVRASASALARLLDGALLALRGEPAVSVSIGGESRVALLDLLRDIERRWSGHARVEGLALRTDLASDLPILIATDGTAIERILSNLLGNALKYAESGTVTLRVDLRDGEDLRFVVEDEGPGFADAALARLFELRGRPPDSGRPGTGLGLHICKELADRIGGQLQVSNGLDRGARVVLSLPRSIWRGSDPETAPEAMWTLLRGKRVLVAEDTVTNQQILTQMLSHMGMDSEVVEDGQAALEALIEGGYDAALVDIQMPKMSGTEVIHAVRKLPDGRACVPMLAVTAFVLREHRDAIYAAGADGILAKPLMSIQAVGEAIASVIRKAATSQADPIPEPRARDVTQIDRGRLSDLLDVAGPEGRPELLRRLDNDLSRNLSGLRAAAAQADTAELRAQTHILISLAGAVGAEALQEVAERLNRACHDGTLPGVIQLAPEAVHGVEYLLAEVQALRGHRSVGAVP